MSPPAGRFIRLVGALVVATGGLQLAGRSIPAEATGAPPAFSAVAAADGARFSMHVPNAPGTSTPIDGGGPSAQAAVSSLGASGAFASLPYPGDLPVRLPGLLAGVGVAGVPQYPFYAASDHPTQPDSKLEAPGYRLQATSREDRSWAEAAGQGPDGSPVSYRSTAAVAPAGDGSVVATAASLARNLRIGDLVIGETDSQARVRLPVTGAIERTAAFHLTGVSIAGTGVSLGPDGITVAGSQSPVPADNPLFAALREHGIAIEYLAPLDTAHGVVAGGLRITVGGTAPDGTRGTAVTTLGRAAASIETGAGVTPIPPVGVDVGTEPGAGVPAGPSGDGSGDGIEPVPAGSAAGAGTESGSASSTAARSSRPPGSFATTPLSGVAPEVSGAAENAAPAGAGTEAAAGPAAALTPPSAIRRVAEPFDAGGFYPMLVVAAALAYAVAQAVRILGVR